MNWRTSLPHLELGMQRVSTLRQEWFEVLLTHAEQNTASYKAITRRLKVELLTHLVDPTSSVLSGPDIEVSWKSEFGAGSADVLDQVTQDQVPVDIHLLRVQSVVLRDLRVDIEIEDVFWNGMNFETRHEKRPLRVGLRCFLRKWPALV